MAREVSPATLELKKSIDVFMSEFEDELRRQLTKTNQSSERRMRKLLRSFHSKIYTPYRDATLPSRNEEQF